MKEGAGQEHTPRYDGLPPGSVQPINERNVLMIRNTLRTAAQALHSRMQRTAQF
jgi:hypothetical protein